MNNIPKDKMNDLLTLASEKLGISKSRLEEQVAGGKLDSVLNNLSGKNAAKVKELLDNPELANQLLSTPQAKTLLAKILKD